MSAAHTVAIVQARMGSSRLPGKVLKPILGRPMLSYIVERLRAVPGVTTVVVATSDRPGDEPVRAFCLAESIGCFAGSETDVLDRFYRAAVREDGDPLLRITGDCPLVDPDLIARLLAMYETARYDHVAVAAGAGAMLLNGGRFPDGLDAECFGFAALERAWTEATLASDREHVTPYIWRNKALFRCGHLLSDVDHSTLRWTVDNEEDFTLVSAIYAALYRPGRPFGMTDVLRLLSSNPALAAANRAFIGREGYEQLWIEKE
jgi:spore coat polysaccharide biosynthesis protein SpsF